MHTYRKIQWMRRFILLIAFVLIADGAGWAGISNVKAQTGSVEWAIPTNLSKSGAAASPVITVTADGRFHVIWVDSFAGSVYTSGDGTQWSDPIPVAFPFSPYPPKLVTDPTGPVNAFWIGEKGGLYYSRLEKQENFGIATAWTRPLLLGYQALIVDATLDDSGRIHLVYMQTLDFTNVPAGIYYRQYELTGRGRNGRWANAIPLYQSPYVRSFTLENARLHVASSTTSNGDRVFVTWDNPARERVMLARSLDGGVTWEAPDEIDTPSDASIAAGPSDISVNTIGDSVLLIWQNESTGSSCSQYYQWSPDGGTNWQPKQRMLQDVPGCPEGNEVFVGEDDKVLLMTSVQKQAYLLAWNGTEWSKPQFQVPLSNFVDPDTYRPVDLACRQATLVDRTRLYVLGCDAGDGKDIWITTRQLDNVDEWFSRNLVWNALTVVTSGQIQVLTPTLVADADNRIHAIWSQPDSVLPNGAGTVIYYARLENGQWSTPGSILASPEGISQQPSAAVDKNGRIYIAWSGGQSGQIYFSSANIVQAAVGTAWSEPILLPSPMPTGSSPNLLIDPEGVLYLAYAVPLNEQRGIYMSRSTDGGATWTEPALVFDAAAAGWGMVDKPHLAQASGALHIVWLRSSVPSGAGELGLYYARSEDGGATWSQATAVVEKPVLWSQIVTLGDKVVHRAWQELDAGRTTLWHEASIDGGQTWSRVAPVSIFGDTIGAPALTVDPVGRLQLLQVVSRGISGFLTQGYVLQHWMYDGQQWVSEQSLDMGDTVAANLRNLASVVSKDGTLAVAFSGDMVDPVTGLSQEQFFFTSRTLDLAVIVPTPQAPESTLPQPTATSSAPAATLATPTATVGTGAAAIENLPANTGGPGNAWAGSIIGPLAAGLIVLVVFVVGVRGANLRRR